MGPLVQIGIVLGMALALLGSIYTYGEKMADKREADLRVELQQEKDRLRAEAEAHEKQMREFAVSLTGNYLKWSAGQRTLAEGLKNELRAEISRNPDLQRICLDAGWVQRFNAAGDRRQGGAGDPARRVDGVVPGKEAPRTPGK